MSAARNWRWSGVPLRLWGQPRRIPQSETYFSWTFWIIWGLLALISPWLVWRVTDMEEEDRTDTTLMVIAPGSMTDCLMNDGEHKSIQSLVSPSPPFFPPYHHRPLFSASPNDAYAFPLQPGRPYLHCPQAPAFRDRAGTHRQARRGGGGETHLGAD